MMKKLSHKIVYRSISSVHLSSDMTNRLASSNSSAREVQHI